MAWFKSKQPAAHAAQLGVLQMTIDSLRQEVEQRRQELCRLKRQHHSDERERLTNERMGLSKAFHSGRRDVLHHLAAMLHDNPNPKQFQAAAVAFCLSAIPVEVKQ